MTTARPVRPSSTPRRWLLVLTVMMAGCCSVVPTTTASSSSSSSTASTAEGRVLLQAPPPQLLRRRLNNERDDCPKDNVRYCDNPNTIMYDPDVYCDVDTCLWDTKRLRQDRKPTLCQNIAIINVDNLDDYLEPCLWWEMMYGYLTPTSTPTITPQPTETRTC